ncbi:GHMP family kinase ATP-binding protein [Haladaptatus caseinilyticus]|uniref:GHMP family kinase ATP-binding protein n=1 Tax=Haladaptatus caseinilyticus TaxID=2993314 RepID=UPI00224A939B|nr:GHMP kinase [Haladaptatus caseinilyticus]
MHFSVTSVMKAFAPGSVTAVFAPTESGDESRGASMAIEDGLVADVRAADRTDVVLDGERTEFEPVENLLDELGVTARVELDADVPIGCGFGASGAATLATALSANERYELGRSHDELVQLSHLAEVEAGTGLGDVFIQSAGGLLMDDGRGKRRWEPADIVEYVSYGGMSTSEALGDDELMSRVQTVGRRILTSFPENPSLERVTRDAWAFARELELPTSRVRDTVLEVEAEGGTASMAMLGETVFAVGIDGVLPNSTQISHEGAHLL